MQFKIGTHNDRCLLNHNYDLFTVSACRRWARRCAWPVSVIIQPFSCLSGHAEPAWVKISAWAARWDDFGTSVSGWHWESGQTGTLGRIPNHPGWKTRQTDDWMDGLTEAQIKSLTSICPHTCSVWSSAFVYRRQEYEPDSHAKIC